MMKPLKLVLLTVAGVALAGAAPLIVKYLYPSEAGPGARPSGSNPAVLGQPGPAPNPAAAKFAGAWAVPDLPAPSSVSVGTIATPAPREVPPSAQAAAATAPAPTPKPEIPYRAEVAEAQRHLAALGFNCGSADGKLGPRTRSAILEFQKKHSLAATGDADSATLAALSRQVAALPLPAPNDADMAAAPASGDDPQFVVLKKPASNLPADAGPVPAITTVADVKRLQERLVAAKVYDGEVDGKWGALTAAAVRKFQEDNKLAVTGKPDEKTWKLLAQVTSGAWAGGAEKSAVAKAATKPAASGVVSREPVQVEMASVAKERPALARDIRITDAAGPARTSMAAPARIVDAVSVSPFNADDIKPLIARTNKALARTPADQGKAEPAPATESGQKSQAASAERPSAVLEVSKPADPPAADPEIDPLPIRRSASPDSLPTAAAEAPSPAAAPSGNEIVVRLNADAGAPSAKPLEPPADLSPEVAGSLGGEKARAVASVDAGLLSAKPSEVASASAQKPAEPAILPPIDSAAAKPARKAAAEKDKAAADQPRIALARNDARFEAEKFVSPGLDAASSLVQKMQEQVESRPSDPAVAAAVKQAGEQIEVAKRDSARSKAEKKVKEVEAAYSTLKDRYGEQVKKEPLADMMGKIDVGYKAMREDFKKGNYDPIIERCDGFKLAIEMLTNDAARLYLEREMEKSSVRSKLTPDERAKIRRLQDRNDHAEAAEILFAKAKEQAKKASTARRQ